MTKQSGNILLKDLYYQSNIETIQKLKRIYPSNKRGLTEKNVSILYLDIDENLNNILFNLPSSFEDIMKCSYEAKEKIKLATLKTVILNKNSYFEELDNLLNAISLNIKKAKENIQHKNMQ